jgi:hypothetical protein
MAGWSSPNRGHGRVHDPRGAIGLWGGAGWRCEVLGWRTVALVPRLTRSGLGSYVWIVGVGCMGFLQCVRGMVVLEGATRGRGCEGRQLLAVFG